MNCILVGCQWGDEGKGRAVDYLAKDYEVVVRFCGGHNAGHTLKIGDKKYVLNLIPSGIVNDHAECLIASGVLVSLQHLQNEIAQLEQSGLKVKDRLKISPHCSIVTSWHEHLDKMRGASKDIGTTGRGIGPCVEDIVGRRAIRIIDLFSEQKLQQKLESMDEFHRKQYSQDKLGERESVATVLHKLLAHRTWFESLLTNVEKTVQTAQGQGKRILFEGAQGLLLDNFHGTYPYVTSNRLMPDIELVMAEGSFNFKTTGIAKAYCTRVGNGPFPTELECEVGAKLAKVGNEFGSTTGRPRRCGWLDLPALKYAIDKVKIEDLFLTKLDVLDGFEQIKVATEYKPTSEQAKIAMDKGVILWEDIEVTYETVPGWEHSLIKTKDGNTELAPNANQYIEFIEDFAKVKVSYVSCGPERGELIVRNAQA